MRHRSAVLLEPSGAHSPPTLTLESARALRRDLMAALPREQVAALHRRRPALHFAVAAWQFGVFVAAALLALRFDDPLIWIPCAVVMGFGVLGFTVLLHDVVHHAVFTRRRPLASALLGLVYAVPSGLAPSQFTRWHLDHHDHLGDAANDPKRAHLSPKVNARWLKALYFTPALFPIYFRAAARGAAAYPAPLRARIRRERALVIGVHLAVILALATFAGPAALARAYLVPYFLVFPVAFALNRLGQHYAIDERDRARWSTRVDGNLAWRVVFLSSNHHLEHHWFPAVPLYNLPALSRALRPFYARRGIPNLTYRELFYSWFVGNHAPHSRWEPRVAGRSPLRAWVELARPFTLLAPMVGIVSGAICALHAAGPAPAVAPVLIAALCAAVLNAASNALNQLTDIENDRWNKPGRPLVTGEIGRRPAWLFVCAAYAAGLLPTWWIVSEPLLGGGALATTLSARSVFLLFLSAAIATVVYSVPELGRTKARGILANITIAVPRGMLLKVAGWGTLASVASAEPWIIGAVFGLFLLGAASTKDFADIEGDRRDGCRTLPVTMGPHRAARAIAPFLVFPWLLLVVGAWVPDPSRPGAAVLTADPVALSLLGVGLAAWGVRTARALLADPDALTRTENHPAWRSMYQMMLAGQVGVALAYLV